MRPDTRPRAKKVPLTKEQLEHRAHSARRRDLLHEGRHAPAPSAAALAERDRNDAALHLLAELETAVRQEAAAVKAGDAAGAAVASKTAALVIEAGAALGYAIGATRGRLGCVREIGFREGPVDEAAAAPVAAAAIARRKAHAATVARAREEALRAAGSGSRPQFVATGKVVDGGKARTTGGIS